MERCEPRRRSFEPSTSATRRPEEGWVIWTSRILEIDSSQYFRWLALKGLGDGEQAFHARHVGAAFDGADLGDTQARVLRQILQGPVALHAEHLDRVAEAFPQAILRRAAQ